MPDGPLPLSVLMVLESLFPSPGGGGAESQVRTLGRRMIAEGVGIEVIVPMLRYGPQIASESVDGIPVRRISYRHIARYGAASLLLQLAWLLWRERTRYQVIHAHIAGNMAALCSLMGRLLGKPVIVKLTGLTEMSGGVLDPRGGLGARLRRRLLMMADGYQATSSRIGRMLEDRGFARDKIHLIPNAVDTERFRQQPRDGARRRELAGDARRVGIYVGRLEAVKGLDLLLRAWADVFAGNREGVLLLVGHGTERDALQRQAQALGIADLVRFLGPSDQVEQYLCLADFALLTSMYEGLSNTMLECMAAGLPMVGSLVSGTEDFVLGGRTGWPFTPGDQAGLAECLRQVAACDEAELQRLGRQASEDVVRRASIDAVVADLIKTYRAPASAG